MRYLYGKENVMPVTEKIYPDWVQAYRTRGKTVKKKGNSYYLYKRTSKRVPGKKYPQPVDTYIGIITPEGIVTSNKKKVTLTEIEVWEFGFSKAVWDLCPEGWKKPLGDEWEDILKIILSEWSPQSYFCRGGLKKREEFRCQFNAQASSLNRRIFKEHGVGIKELESLKSVYLVIMGKEKVVSKLWPQQKILIDSLGLSMEV